DICTVVGVLPGDFVFVENPVDLFIPLQRSESLGDRGYNTSAIARLKPGVNLAQAQTEMAVLFPQIPDKDSNLLGLGVLNYQRLLTGDIRPSLSVLFGAVGLLILIACVNVASLVLARTYMRTREISIRLALGAGRMQIARVRLTERYHTTRLRPPGHAVRMQLSRVKIRSEEQTYELQSSGHFVYRV